MEPAVQDADAILAEIANFRVALAETPSEKKAYARARRQSIGRWIVGIAGGVYAVSYVLPVLAP